MSLGSSCPENYHLALCASLITQVLLAPPPRSPGIPLKGLVSLTHPPDAAGAWLIAPTWEPRGSVPGSPILPGDAAMADLVQG